MKPLTLIEQKLAEFEELFSPAHKAGSISMDRYLKLLEGQKSFLQSFVKDILQSVGEEAKEVRWEIYEVEKNAFPDMEEAEKVAKNGSGFENVHRINLFDDWAIFDKNSPYQAKSGLRNAFIDAIRRYKLRDDLYWVFICYPTFVSD